jgi:hypothetical protein
MNRKNKSDGMKTMRRWKDELARCPDWTKKASAMNVVCKGTSLIEASK